MKILFLILLTLLLTLLIVISLTTKNNSSGKKMTTLRNISNDGICTELCGPKGICVKCEDNPPYNNPECSKCKDYCYNGMSSICST
jgi:hypothetical protein